MEKDVRDLFSAVDTQVDGRGAIAAAAVPQLEDVGVAAPAPLTGPLRQSPWTHARVPRSPPGEVTAEEGGDSTEEIFNFKTSGQVFTLSAIVEEGGTVVCHHAGCRG